jgi:hypothetical protein
VLKDAVAGLWQTPTFFSQAIEKECWTRDRLLSLGGRLEPTSFYDFAHRGYPNGLNSNYEKPRRVIELSDYGFMPQDLPGGADRYAEHRAKALEAFDRLTHTVISADRWRRCWSRLRLAAQHQMAA